jgi:hypothetical protein
MRSRRLLTLGPDNEPVWVHLYSQHIGDRWAAIAIPNLLSAQGKSKYARAASDTRTATTQAIVCSNDKDQNPGTLAALRTGGYANVDDTDPWGRPIRSRWPSEIRPPQRTLARWAFAASAPPERV